MLKTVMQNLLAILIGVLLVALIEVVLLLGGVRPLVQEDRFVGFAGNSPVYLPGDSSSEGTIYELNPAKKLYFNQQKFMMPKPANRFRVVSLGGSTTYGRPYFAETAFSRWVVALADQFAGPLQYESINAGGISYASYRVARVQKESVDYNPDLFIVYSGHNEFLEARTFADLKDQSDWISGTREVLHQSRIYSLIARIIEKLGVVGGSTLLPDEVSVELETVAGTEFYHRDDNFRQGVLRQYRAGIQQMIDQASDSQIPIILCTLPSNLSGVSPFKSEHRDGLTAEESSAWNRLFRNGNRAIQSGHPAAAVSSYFEALEIDDRYALLHYRLGSAWLAQEKTEQAYTAFVRAKEEDIIPLRALEEMNDIIRDLANQNAVPLADVAATFNRVAVNGIPGPDLFDDHVHPNIRGQQLIAWVVFDSLVKAKLIPLETTLWKGKVNDARQFLLDLENDVSLRYRAQGVWGVGRLYFWAGKYQEAYVALKKAWELLKDVPEIPMKLGALEVFRGDGAAAVPLLEEAIKLNPQDLNVPVMLANAYLLLDQGQRALLILDKLPEDRDERVGALSAKGRALISIGRYSEGIDALTRALILAPGTERATRELAEAFAFAGRLDDAQVYFKAYLLLTHSPDAERLLQSWLQQEGWRTPREWLAQEMEQ